MWVQEVVAVLRGAFTFLSRPDFLVNFVANLGGALCGVFLGFLVERRRRRRDAMIERRRRRRVATRLYGRLLSTSRSELSYLRPMCKKAIDHLKAGTMGSLGSLSVPATRALLVNPLVHEKAPYSLIMALTILSTDAEGTEDALRWARMLIKDRKLTPEAGVLYYNALASKAAILESLLGIALERLDLELTRLGIKVTVDPETQEVSRKLLEVLQGPKS
jgi:hypothetical protein